ncbi:PRTRC system protein B [Sphingomonas sp. 1185]|uniref:PRTRC system protein B n=1 Tax=Sphingomonas sp. 1185 TaxID=3156411 RepID=UPI00339A319F
MNDNRTSFVAPGGSLTLSHAILLYRSGGALQKASAFASIHLIELDDEDRPTIAAGVPLSRAHLRHWGEVLGRATRPELLPENVLVAHSEMLAWWTPEQVRPGFFALSNPPPDLHRLAERTIVPVPYPAHLFVATRSRLGVFALPVNERPIAETLLRHSPILNVFSDGQLCWGTVPRPASLEVASIPAFERAVFDSWSTHTNPGQDLTVTGKGGLIRLWDDLAAREAKRFPVRRLKPFVVRANARARTRGAQAAAEPMTLARIIARGGK